MNPSLAKAALNVASTVQALANAMLSPPKASDHLRQFDTLVEEEEIRAASRDLFRDAYYTQSVLEAYKCLNNYVKDRTGLRNEDGSGLMERAFSESSPILKLTGLKTKSQQDMQKGYLRIYAGCMTGVRNPRAHEHKHCDEAQAALELIVWANHLMRLAKNATRARSRRRPRTP